MKSWLIVDDYTGEIIGQADSLSEAKELFEELAKARPDDGHTWSLYGRRFA